MNRTLNTHLINFVAYLGHSESRVALNTVRLKSDIPNTSQIAIRTDNFRRVAPTTTSRGGSPNVGGDAMQAMPRNPVEVVFMASILRETFPTFNAHVFEGLPATCQNLL